jgi:hypothetical protein
MPAEFCDYKNCQNLASSTFGGYCNQYHLDRATKDEAPSGKRCVLNFSLQVSNGQIDAWEFLRSVDKDVPKPAPLEGGDGNGCLYFAVIAIEKRMDLIERCEKAEGVRVYKLKEFGILEPFCKLYIDSDRYSSSGRVEWNFGSVTVF